MAKLASAFSELVAPVASARPSDVSDLVGGSSENFDQAILGSDEIGSCLEDCLGCERILSIQGPSEVEFLCKGCHNLYLRAFGMHGTEPEDIERFFENVVNDTEFKGIRGDKRNILEETEPPKKKQKVQQLEEVQFQWGEVPVRLEEVNDEVENADLTDAIQLRMPGRGKTFYGKVPPGIDLNNLPKKMDTCIQQNIKIMKKTTLCDNSLDIVPDLCDRWY